MGVGRVGGPKGFSPSPNSAAAEVQTGSVSEEVQPLNIEAYREQKDDEVESIGAVRAQVQRLEGQAGTVRTLAQAPATDKVAGHQQHPGLMALAFQLQAEADNLKAFTPAKKNTTDQVVSSVELVGKKVPPGLAKKS